MCYFTKQTDMIESLVLKLRILKKDYTGLSRRGQCSHKGCKREEGGSKSKNKCEDGSRVWHDVTAGFADQGGHWTKNVGRL